VRGALERDWDERTITVKITRLHGRSMDARPASPNGMRMPFASVLILPNYLVDLRLRKIKRPTLNAARQLAEELCTSLTATLFKMTLLNRFPKVIVCNNKRRSAGSRRAP
jgi:hypothetical protein